MRTSGERASLARATGTLTPGSAPSRPDLIAVAQTLALDVLELEARIAAAQVALEAPLPIGSSIMRATDKKWLAVRAALDPKD